MPLTIPPLPILIGRVASTNGGDPAAGAEQSYTVPSGLYIELQSINFALVTSATVNNRVVKLTIDDGTNLLWEVQTAVTQAASLTYKYSYGAGCPQAAAVAGTTVSLPLPIQMTLAPGYRVKTVTTLLDSGDNYGQMNINGVRISR